MTQTIFQFARPQSEWKPPNPPELRLGEPVAIDFESTPGQPWNARPVSIGIYSPGQRKSWFLPWGHEGGGNLPEEIVKRWCQNELRGRDVYGLNVKYECHMGFNWGLDPTTWRPHDVAFSPTLLNENRRSGFSLAALAEEYLPADERKQHPLGIHESEFYRAHAGEIAARCESDAFLAWRIHEVTQAEIKNQDLNRVLDLEDKCILPTCEMERNGMIIDRSKLEQWAIQIDERISTLFMDTYRETGLPVNPNKSKEMARLFAHLSLPKPTCWDEASHSEEESWAEEALSTVKHPTVRRVALLKRWMSMKSKYITKYLDKIDSKNVLRYHLHQLRGDENGTVTGRYSSGSRQWPINIQQVSSCKVQRREMGDDFLIRELFIPPAGQILAACDASQIEFRLFGHYAKSKFILDAYATDPWTDFHAMVTRMFVAGREINEKEFEIERDLRKRQNFAKVYGVGRPKLCRQLGFPCSCPYDWRERDDNARNVRYFGQNHFHDADCPALQGNAIIDEYEKKFPEAGQLLKQAGQRAEERGYVHTLLGRRRRYPDAKRLHSAFNAVDQGSAADIFKIKLVELYNNRRDLGITLRAPVHDEFVMDLDQDPIYAKRLEELLNMQSIPLSVPILWECGFGKNWREANGQ